MLKVHIPFMNHCMWLKRCFLLVGEKMGSTFAIKLVCRMILFPICIAFPFDHIHSGYFTQGTGKAQFTMIDTLWSFNIAIENHHFLWEHPL